MNGRVRRNTHLSASHPGVLNQSPLQQGCLVVRRCATAQVHLPVLHNVTMFPAVSNTGPVAVARAVVEQLESQASELGLVSNQSGGLVAQ